MHTQRNRHGGWVFTVGLAVCLMASPVFAGQLYIYPSKGQSQEQQEKDRYQCHSWAVRETGFDPMNPPAPSTPPPSQEAPQGGLVRGGARGAAVGAVGGAIGGNAGKGAAIGAASGAMIGGMRRSDQRRRQQQAQANYESQRQAQLTQGRAAYDRALSACLTGRGYTVQ